MHPAETIVKKFVTAMGYPNASVVASEIAGQTILSIHADGDPREMIGPHGDTIHAIDHLVKKIVEKSAPHRESAPEGSSAQPVDPPAPLGASREPMFLVDVDEYRSRQIKDLQMKAKMMAERARSFQYDVELSPMSAYERLIIHTALAEEPNVKTESQGEGRSRRVVIKYSAG